MQNENDDDDIDDNAKFEGNADYKTCWNTYKEVLNLDLFANKLNEFFYCIGGSDWTNDIIILFQQKENRKMVQI